ncbi:hypothetical protein GCM10010385_68260 [Streptomyces geysiriensis]|nr:hypothetical protein GCM10010385_68260 [Streptomyces geysiriensis]GHC43551.1 hypothetical protein GCM10010308_73450 [Streptomyces vinaceusdrappus]
MRPFPTLRQHARLDSDRDLDRREQVTATSEVTTTDLYEVTMALSYLREDMNQSATFSLFVRSLPPERAFLVSAGTEPALDHLSDFHVTAADLEVFASALRRPTADIAPLSGMTFTGEVRAVPEGRIVYAGEPLLEVTAPIAQAQLVETFLLNQISRQNRGVQSGPLRPGCCRAPGGRLLAAPHARHLRRARDLPGAHVRHGARGAHSGPGPA